MRLPNGIRVPCYCMECEGEFRNEEFYSSTRLSGVGETAVVIGRPFYGYVHLNCLMVFVDENVDDPETRRVWTETYDWLKGAPLCWEC
jgi:hypothetical protein